MCIVGQAESRSKRRETVTGIWRGRPESRRTSNRSCALPFEGDEVIHGTHSEGTRGINDTSSVFFFSLLSISWWIPHWPNPSGSWEVRDPMKPSTERNEKGKVHLGKEIIHPHPHPTDAFQHGINLASQDVFPLGSEEISWSVLASGAYILMVFFSTAFQELRVIDWKWHRGWDTFA